MSNRQKARLPWLRKAPRRARIVSASHGPAEFRPAEWFEENKVKPCRTWKKCGIRSTPKHPHFHPSGAR